MLKGLTNTFKNNCNAKTLTYNEYVKLNNTNIQVKATLDDDCYENGNFIGTFIFKTIRFQTDATYDFKNKEFEYYKKVNNESIKIGTFITTEIAINDTNDLVSVVAMDFGLKTQIEYTSELNYAGGNITLLDVWNEACTLSGLTSGINSFTNSNFIVDSDQFSGTGATIRDVFKAIAMSSGTFVKVMNDDKIYLIFTETTNDTIEDYTDLKDKRDTHPWTCIRLGVSQIDGEYVEYKDTQLIEEYGENWLILNDNPFAYTQAKREALIMGIFNQIKEFGYSAFESKTSFKPYLTCGDKVKFINRNGNEVDSIILRYTHNGEEIDLSAPSETTSTVNYVYPLTATQIAKNAEISVDKANARINGKVSKGEVMGEMQIEIDDETNESIVRFHSNKFILDADNASIDEYGNATFKGATLTDGNLLLQDDGTKENSAMKIQTKTQYFDDLATGLDISNKKLKFNLKDYTYENLVEINNEELIVTEYTENNETTTYFIYLDTYTEQITNEKYLEVNIQEVDVRIPNMVLRIKLKNNVVPNNFEIELYEHFGEITELLNNAIIDDIQIITYEVERETSYSGNGIETDILPNYAYDINDVLEVADKIDQPGYVFTKEEIERWDVNGDGIVDSEDLTLIQDYTIYNITPTSPGHLKLDTQTIDYNFKLTDGNNRLRFAYGFNGLNINGHKLYADADGILLLDNVSIVYFQPGDYTFNNIYIGGAVSGSSTSISFNVTTSLDLYKITSISCVSGSISIRGTAGYVESSGSSPYFSMTNTSSYTYTFEKVTRNSILVTIKKKSGTFSNVTNNTPVNVQLRSVKLRFS